MFRLTALFLLPASAVLALALVPSSANATKNTAPRPASEERLEEFDWKSEKRTRGVIELDLGGGEKLELVRVRAGAFMMGSPADDLALTGDNKAFLNETPQHKVTIPRDFFIGKYEVTKGQFARFAAAADYKTEAKGGSGYNSKIGKFEFGSPDYTWKHTGWEQTDRHPVVNVTWNDAEAFCKWAEKQTSRAVRLPSEAEWEYSCRGGTTTRFFTGATAGALKGYANVADRSAKAKFPEWQSVDFDDGYAFTAPVGQFKPNGFGLHDMVGNAWEWTGDWQGNYESTAVSGPRGPMAGTLRVYRGGGFCSTAAWGCRSAFRYGLQPADRNHEFGFRIVAIPSKQ